METGITDLLSHLGAALGRLAGAAASRALWNDLEGQRRNLGTRRPLLMCTCERCREIVLCMIREWKTYLPSRPWRGLGWLRWAGGSLPRVVVSKALSTGLCTYSTTDLLLPAADATDDGAASDGGGEGGCTCIRIVTWIVLNDREADTSYIESPFGLRSHHKCCTSLLNFIARFKDWLPYSTCVSLLFLQFLALISLTASSFFWNVLHFFLCLSYRSKASVGMMIPPMLVRATPIARLTLRNPSASQWTT